MGGVYKNMILGNLFDFYYFIKQDLRRMYLNKVLFKVQ
jgi:hypothetical protein